MSDPVWLKRQRTDRLTNILQSRFITSMKDPKWCAMSRCAQEDIGLKVLNVLYEYIDYVGVVLIWEYWNQAPYESIVQFIADVKDWSLVSGFRGYPLLNMDVKQPDPDTLLFRYQKQPDKEWTNIGIEDATFSVMRYYSNGYLLVHSFRCSNKLGHSVTTLFHLETHIQYKFATECLPPFAQLFSGYIDAIERANKKCIDYLAVCMTHNRNPKRELLQYRTEIDEIIHGCQQCTSTETQPPACNSSCMTNFIPKFKSYSYLHSNLPELLMVYQPSVVQYPLPEQSEAILQEEWNKLYQRCQCMAQRHSTYGEFPTLSEWTDFQFNPFYVYIQTTTPFNPYGNAPIPISKHIATIPLTCGDLVQAAMIRDQFIVMATKKSNICHIMIFDCLNKHVEGGQYIFRTQDLGKLSTAIFHNDFHHRSKFRRGFNYHATQEFFVFQDYVLFVTNDGSLYCVNPVFGTLQKEPLIHGQIVSMVMGTHRWFIVYKHGFQVWGLHYGKPVCMNYVEVKDTISKASVLQDDRLALYHDKCVYVYAY